MDGSLLPNIHYRKAAACERQQLALTGSLLFDIHRRKAVTGNKYSGLPQSRL
jgi:hypothetical protein